MLKKIISRNLAFTTSRANFKGNEILWCSFFYFSSSAADLVIERAQNLKAKPENPENVAFGHVFTDHMLEIDYDANNGGWGKPKISEFGNLSLVGHLSLNFLENQLNHGFI